MQTAIDKQFDNRMQRWAYICMARQDGNLGYPRQAVEGRLQKEGGVLPARKGRSMVLVDAEFIETEHAMASLRDYKPNWAHVVEERHLMEHDWNTISRIAHCSVPSAREWYAKGRAFLIGGFQYQEQYKRAAAGA